MITKRHILGRKPHPRQGNIYIIVMGTAMIVSLLGFSALTLQRVTRRSYQNSSDLFQARQNAGTALRIAMLRIEDDPNWRYTFPNGVWESDVNVHGTSMGTYTIDGQDPGDANLANSATDPLVLTGIGKKGHAVQKVQITLVPLNRAMNCLQVGMHSNGIMTFEDATLNFSGTISSNYSVTETGISDIDVKASVEAVVDITGNDFNGPTTTGVNSRDTPSASSVFDYYISNGTNIDINDVVTTNAPNMLVNGDMESGTTDWYDGGIWNIAQDATAPHGGTNALKITNRLFWWHGARQYITNLVQKDVDYTVKAWVKMESGTADVRLTINTYNGTTHQYFNDPLDYVTVGTTWTQVQSTLQPTWTGSLSSSYVLVETVPGTGTGDFQVDDVTMTKKQPPARTIYLKVLSPNSNPYDEPTNPEGIYVIDCQGQDIYIQDSRIVGTLVLLNTGSSSKIRTSGTVNWTPFISNFPALLVDGPFTIRGSNIGLNETFSATNFNPIGTPDASLSPIEDSDTNDTYLSKITGLVYTSGDLIINKNAKLDGVVISDGTITVQDTFDLTYQQIYVNPPPGFNNSEEIRILLKSATKKVD